MRKWRLCHNVICCQLLGTGCPGPNTGSGQGEDTWSLMNKKILTNTFFYTIVTFLPLTLNYFVLPFLTRYMSAADFGIVSLVGSLVSFLTVLFGLQMHSGVNRLIFDYKGDDRKSYFSSLFWAITLVSFLFLAIFFASGNFLRKILFYKNDLGFYPYLFIAGLKIFFALPLLVTHRFFRVLEKAKILVVITFLTSTFSVAVTLLFVIHYRLGATGALSGILAGTVLTYLCHLYHFRKMLVLKFDKDMFLENLKFGIPAIPHGLGGYLFLFSDRIILEKFVPLSVIGVYSIADTFSILLKHIVNSFDLSIRPIFMKKCLGSISDGVDFAQRMSRVWFIGLGAAYFAICFFGELIIKLMTPQEFHGAVNLLPILALCYVLRGIYIFPLYTFYFQKKTKYLSAITLPSGLLNIIFNFILIPLIGVYGAALTTLGSFVFNLTFARIYSKNTFRINFSPQSILALVLLCAFTIIPHWIIPFDNLALRMVLKLAMFLSIIFVMLALDIGGIRGMFKKIFLKGSLLFTARGC